MSKPHKMMRKHLKTIWSFATNLVDLSIQPIFSSFNIVFISLETNENYVKTTENGLKRSTR